MNFFLCVVLLFKCLKIIEANFNLVILHTNDMHARYEQVNSKGGPCDEIELEKKQCYGGFPRLHYAVNQIKEEAERDGKNVILLSAGDTYLGTNYHSAFIWEIASEMMNQLNFDMMCLGNHEFDDSVDNLIPFLERVKFPVVCCNINSTREERLYSSNNLYPSYVMNINGTKIGFIGYITQKTKTISRPGKVKILDEIVTIRSEVEKLKNEGVKIIIGLGHSGIDKDIEIVKSVPDIDAIIGGHSHTILYNGIPPDEFKDRLYGPYPKMVSRDNGSSFNVPIAHAFAFTRFLGKLDLIFDDEGNIVELSGNAIPLETDMKEDESTKAILQKWKDKLIEKEKETIGKTDVFLDGGFMTCRSQECNMGNLITDAFVDFNNKNGFDNTGIAIYPAGGIRYEINATTKDGVITTGDLMRVLPFRDRVYQTELQGKHFREVLEHSVSSFGNRSSRHAEFLQLSGVKVVYDLLKPVGERVVSVLVQPQYPGEYEELNDDAVYKIILPDCLSHGSDGYSMFPEHSATHWEISNSVYELVKNYINITSPIKTTNSDRIIIMGRN